MRSIIGYRFLHLWYISTSKTIVTETVLQMLMFIADEIKTALSFHVMNANTKAVKSVSNWGSSVSIVTR
jgi:predicted urease superfamily metal-dependent hydrolase